MSMNRVNPFITLITCLLVCAAFTSAAQTARDNVFSVTVSSSAELRTLLASLSRSVSADPELVTEIVLDADVFSSAEDGLGPFEYVNSGSSPLVLRGAEGRNVTLDGANTSAVLSLRVPEDTTITLQDLTIANGFSTTSGAGLTASNRLIINNVVFQDNVANAAVSALNMQCRDCAFTSELNNV